MATMKPLERYSIRLERYRDYQEQLNVLQNLEQKKDAKGLIQVLASDYSFSTLVLLLHALNIGDKEPALTHALIEKYHYPSQILKELFGELAESLKNNNDEGMRLTLIKLLYLHI
jgi:hypothetical protein